MYIGGRGEIRTRDKVTPVPPFQGGDLNRSSTLPFAKPNHALQVADYIRCGTLNIATHQLL